MNPAELFALETDPIRLVAGEILFKEGDAPDAMYVLLEGELEIKVSGITVEEAIRGAVIGEMALIDPSPRSATVIARQAATLAKLDSARFQRIIKINPFFALHLMKVLVERLRHTSKILKEKKGD